jgi:hypothetical protein
MIIRNRRVQPLLGTDQLTESAPAVILVSPETADPYYFDSVAGPIGNTISHKKQRTGVVDVLDYHRRSYHPIVHQWQP